MKTTISRLAFLLLACLILNACAARAIHKHNGDYSTATLPYAGEAEMAVTNLAMRLSSKSTP